MRKTPYESTRGPYQYNVNGLPIQSFYRLFYKQDRMFAVQPPPIEPIPTILGRSSMRVISNVTIPSATR